MSIDDMIDRLFDTGILLQGLPPEECFGRIKSAFQAVVLSKEIQQNAQGKISWDYHWESRVNKKDEEALFLCQLFEQEYRRQARENDFCSFLIDDLYWQLPDSKQYLQHHWTQNWAPLIGTKKWIWEKAVKEWDPFRTACGKNLDTFLFLIAAFNPRAKNDAPLEDETLYERKARGRFITPYEQGQILELVHQRVKDVPVFLEQWFTVPRVPIEIRKKLAHAWVNERGWRELSTLFARSAAIGDQKVERCSAEGQALLQEWSQLLVDFDIQLQRITRMLSTASGMPSELTVKAGAHRYLLGSGNIRIVIGANFEERYTREETLAIFNQILAVVTEWRKGEHNEFTDGVFVHGRKIDVAINVQGKCGVFDSFEFSSSI